MHWHHPTVASPTHDGVVRRRWLSRERPVRTALFVGERAQLFAQLRDHLGHLFTAQLLGQFTGHGDEARHDRGELDGQNTASRFVIGH